MTNGSSEKSNNINVQSLLKVVAVTLAIAGALIGVVVYVEHKFQCLGEDISALKVDVRHIQTNLDGVNDETNTNREEYTNAIKAIQENQYQLALKIAECCATRSNANAGAYTVPSTLLPYNLAFKPNPGIVIHKGHEMKNATAAGSWFSETPLSAP